MPITPSGAYRTAEEIRAVIDSRPFFLRMLRILRQQRRFDEARVFLASLRTAKEWESTL